MIVGWSGCQLESALLMLVCDVQHLCFTHSVLKFPEFSCITCIRYVLYAAFFSTTIYSCNLSMLSDNNCAALGMTCCSQGFSAAVGWVSDTLNALTRGDILFVQILKFGIYDSMFLVDIITFYFLFPDK